MLIRLDSSLGTPLYEQLATAVRSGVAAGQIAAGEKLPPARELATTLGVNVHTVLRGYAILREEGLLEVRRGRGAVVTAGAEGATSADRAAFRDAVATVHLTARRLGLTADDLAATIRKGYQP
ncbi:GntR family transcriptional regulator [Serinibacter salmoneus]|uniref:DNA-binding transcriptional regulator YhcF (GntR family) n=1 Tax=Serinibacter salmoneus TaxID=556530 RepID=A0A2A9CZ69_9MICO|nr:GntR family transcriptional regulator [Serinibacter salmoneus]PFG19421.1 DNA-binding transcriptional regulator YhcF (GntR family) [Serinibacter salmoneus]